MSMNRNRIEYISLASVVSAIAVVFLHTNGCFFAFSTARYWFTANIMESVFYFAVPIFFMISGAMLIDYDERYDTKTFFLKRINKTVIPFIIWSLVGLVFQVYYLHSVNISDVNLTYIVNGLSTGHLTRVFWFFIPLFCNYLVIPLFSAVPKDKNMKLFTYLVGVGFVLNILVPFIISVFGLGIDWRLTLGVSAGFLFYTLTGYLLHKYELDRKFQLLIYLFAVIGLVIRIVGTYTLSMDAGTLVTTYNGYTDLPCVLYSFGVFVFIKYDLVKIMKFAGVSKLVNFLNPYTFGIYLLHYFIMEIIVKVFSINTTSIAYRLLTPFVIIAIAVCVIWIVQKIPGGKRVIP